MNRVIRRVRAGDELDFVQQVPLSLVGPLGLLNSDGQLVLKPCTWVYEGSMRGL